MENWSFLEAVRFQIGGLALVFAALCVIALFVYGVGYFFRKKVDQESVPPLERIPENKPCEMPGNHLAVITAAVNEVIREPHRIVSIRRIDTEQISGELHLQAWSEEGRRQNFTSHNIR